MDEREVSTPEADRGRDAGPPGPGSPSSPADPVLDEVTAVARAQDGDLAAFEALVDRYQAPIFRLAFRVLHDRPAAEDVVQETFVAAWRKLPTLIEPAAFRGWLYQVATRRSLDLLRRRRPQVSLDTDSAPELPGPAWEDPASSAERRAQLDELRRVLDALPEDLAVCWRLKELDGLAYAEIAAALGIPESTVRGRIARARRTLVERMEAWR
ncbi:RNA polymerase sigma-70 factor (ECF subfamily) [Friedmanniella endophytica]|uniref:RNA polymerase sigma-70 factor (ECF subfamily) n=1 Tax=Microlunatus kandeliicorticis TaxID=1759536 RepID=A0A7W3P5D5_9ACTN|nr:sigma-70 family RNA polymerase sigma factor [Microlunatus kandeliicorticis]MBA8793813.1 RNA polymerase sigma-70 factor (ECF subfamily) [Microlunatus kandeliicorticis]